MIIEKHKLIFIHIRKTAGTTIVHTLLSSILNKETSGPMSRLSNSLQTKYSLTDKLKHASAYELQQYIGEEKWNQYYKFTFVRNPWDRTVSSFHWAKRINKKFKNLTFEEFLMLIKKHKNDIEHPLNHLLLPQTSFIKNNKGDIIIDKIFPFERLIDSMNLVCSKKNIKFDKIKKRNVTKKRKPYREYYTQKTQKIILENYRDDVLTFNYKF